MGESLDDARGHKRLKQLFNMMKVSFHKGGFLIGLGPVDEVYEVIVDGSDLIDPVYVGTGRTHFDFQE